MKKILTILLSLLFSPSVFAEYLTDTQQVECRSVWARVGNISMKNSDEGVSCIIYDGKADFCSHSSRSYDVKPGEIYEMTCDMKAVGRGDAGISVILGKDKKTFEWVYGSQSTKNTVEDGNFQHVVTKFVIPEGRNLITPRIVGVGVDGNYRVYFRNYTLRKIGEIKFPTEVREYIMENEMLKVTLEGKYASLQVQDKRSRRVWTQNVTNANFCILKSRKTEENCVMFEAFNMRNMQEFQIYVTLEVDKPEIVVKISGNPEIEMTSTISYPYAFNSAPTDRILIPMNEGISFPVTEAAPGAGSLVGYGGHGICMGFWAQCEEEFVPAKNSDASAPNQIGEIRGKSGYLAILETSDDVRVETKRTDDKSLLNTSVTWEGQKGKLGYDRVLRFVFFDQANVTTVMKRYREYASSIGLVVPFTEKVKINPALKEGFDRLIGAANIWYFGGNKVDFYKEMQKAGIKKILASAGGNAEEIRLMNAMPNVLTSRYDIYQDSMDPSKYELVGRTPGQYGDWTSEAWERDELMTDVNGDWIRGWGVSQVDKTKPRISCGVLCDMCAVEYERERVAKDLANRPFRARFIDTTTASPWRECYHPKHPCTRTESKIAKMELLGVLGREFNLVTGSETGHEASVPYCDFYEGMMSLGSYRVPDSGRNLTEIWDVPPENTEKYQVGEAYRMPLWELVYHDCTVSYWYWGDYNNKLPSLWKKRDLFNALYGVPPMYLFSQDLYSKIKERMIASYAIAQPVSEKTGWHEMTAFRVISKDRTVQQTEFANGIRVTVNFGDIECMLGDGTILKAKSVKIEENIK